MRRRLLLFTAVGLATAEPATVRDLGIPVRGVNWGRIHAGATVDGNPSILVSFGQNNGGLFVADVDFGTGHCRQFAVQNPTASTFPTASFRSLRTGMLYIGSAWDGHLHRFDPARPELGIVDLGAIDPGEAIFPTGITEAADGMIFIGTCNGARLVRFDPASGEFTRVGRMDETDNYLYPLAGDDGSLAALVKVESTLSMSASDLRIRRGTRRWPHPAIIASPAGTVKQPVGLPRNTLRTQSR
jgi:outer membrane protein assembly factor BamB